MRIGPFILVHDRARELAVDAVQNAPHGLCVVIKEADRTLEQNAAQWPILSAFSKQLVWPVNGQMVKMTPDEWKDVLSAAFEGDTNPRLAMGLNGGVVMLGKRTSKFGKAKFSEYLEFLHAVAADRGVVVYPDEIKKISAWSSDKNTVVDCEFRELSETNFIGCADKRQGIGEIVD